jgi:hypothetical protein
MTVEQTMSRISAASADPSEVFQEAWKSFTGAFGKHDGWASEPAQTTQGCLHPLAGTLQPTLMNGVLVTDRGPDGAGERPNVWYRAWKGE